MNENDFKSIISKKVLSYLNSQNGIGTIKGCDYTQLMLLLFDMNRKWIPSQPRNVHFSNELQRKIHSSVLPQSIIDNIIVFEQMFQQGENINGHLSTNIYSPSKLDALLNYWNIHHLHLNIKDAKTPELMHKNRSSFYLLFLVDHSDVYFLDCVKHLTGAEFASLEFLDIIFNNKWEKIVPFIEMPEIVGVSYEIDKKEQLYQIWQSNMNYCIFQHNGKYYGSPRGVMLSGNSISDMDCICNLNKKLFRLSQKGSVVLQDVKVMEDNDILSLSFIIDGKISIVSVINETGHNSFSLNN